MSQADHARVQAASCAALGSPMYAALLARLADDLEAGGPTAAVLAGHEDAPGPSALWLRLLGSVHRLVLERRAGALATFYPSVGGAWHDELGPQAFLTLLEEQPEAVREWLDRPPQTNEVGRAAALVGALLHLPPELRLPVRLVELGSSAGLNQLADRFSYVDGGGGFHGAVQSPVLLAPAWQVPAVGLAPWPALTVVERLGCDPDPVDPATTQGRLALTAYVWPDQPHRHERLRGALALAESTPPDVRRCGAGDLLAGLDLVEGRLTVVWHSVMWQYLPARERGRVEAEVARLAAGATPDRPVARISLEPGRRAPGRPHEFLVSLESWPGEGRRVLGVAHPHGVPVTWDH